MRTTAVALSLLALLPAAQAESTPYALPLTISQGYSWQRLTLPPEVYRLAAFADLRDLRVLDARQEAQPFAWVPPAPPVTASVDLPLYPVPATAEAGGGTDQLQLYRGSDGSIRLQLAGSPDNRPTAPRSYLIDRGAEPRPALTALNLDWQAPQADVLLTLTVQQSDDLQHWQPLAGPATLARLQHGRQLLHQGRLTLPTPGGRYLRLQGDWPASLRLTQAHGEYLQQAAHASQRLPQTAARKTNDGGFEFDLGGHFPLERLHFVYTGPRLLLPAELLSRPDEQSRWQRHGAQVVYKLDGAMPPVEVGSNHRYWKLQPDSRIGTPVPSALRLVGEYRPQQIVFVAQGEPPYRLQFGDGFNDTAGHLPYATLLPDAGRAAVGEAAVSGKLLSEAGSWYGRVAHLHWRKLLLWLVLLSGVGLMVWMVLRLGRQTRQ